MNYTIEVREIKGVGKCRLCHDKIERGSLVVSSESTDGYNFFRFKVHAECLMKELVEKMILFKKKKSNENLKEINNLKKQFSSCCNSERKEFKK